MADAPDLELVPEDVEFGMTMEEILDDNDAEYVPRQRNLGKPQHRKFTGFDQRLPVVIYGIRKETVHGTSSTGVPHSLIVFHWTIQQRNTERQFKWVKLRAMFQTKRRRVNGALDAYYDPHVVNLEPNGTYSMLPVPVTTSRTRSVEGGIEVGVEHAKGTGKVTYELSQTAEAKDCIIINGSEQNDYNKRTADEVGDPDRCNVVEWNLIENRATRSGLPTSFHTAVLLERRDEDEEQFLCTFTVRGSVDGYTDAVTRVKRWFGMIPRDDPIIFDPKSVEDGEIENNWKKKLDKVDLFRLCKYVMFKTGLGSTEGGEK
ncbi:hypothetical protein QBC40DRAFT_266639 [Triangularia verruculosa]|uniref:Uncharacterized protein n=1 Tax=Triangularia verruculosa TaxID=2587418 RepID=A0AAN6XH74_9PEZI|nr:hypothetical protein QBC40DRAFT_266639 [Triangularia verruculosa]